MTIHLREFPKQRTLCGREPGPCLPDPQDEFCKSCKRSANRRWPIWTVQIPNAPVGDPGNTGTTVTNYSALLYFRRGAA